MASQDPPTELPASHLIWRDLLQDSLDGALDDIEKGKLNEHLQTCGACRAEQAKLFELHALFQAQFGTAPALSADFSARVLANIDEHELARRAAAKLLAERDFQKRIQAFKLDWRSLWQRHMGSIIAAATTIAAVTALFGSTVASLRGQLLSALPSLAGLQDTMTITASVLAASIVVSGVTFWILRTKAH